MRTKGSNNCLVCPWCSQIHRWLLDKEQAWPTAGDSAGRLFRFQCEHCRRWVNAVAVVTVLIHAERDLSIPEE